jgi:imidazole glycerol phosphate synthase subunit HisF
LMVSEDSSAVVIYDDGCRQKYKKPGVYEISATCVLPIILSSGPSKGLVVAGIFVTGGAIAAAIDHSGNNNPPPVSR